MKRLIPILIVLCLLLCSCAPAEAMLYEDSFDELDIGGRLNEIAFLIDRGSTSPLLLSALDTVIEDLNSLSPQDPMLQQLNENFISVAELLSDAVEMRKEGNEDACRSCYESAKSLYNSTDTQLNLYKKGPQA